MEEEQKHDQTSPITENENGANTKPSIIKIDKIASLAYNFSDDIRSSDDEIGLDDRKYTHQSQPTPTEEELPPASTTKPMGRQYNILLNDKSFLSVPDANFPTNYIKTAKYTLLTFIPLNLSNRYKSYRTYLLSDSSTIFCEIAL